MSELASLRVGLFGPYLSGICFPCGTILWLSLERGADCLEDESEVDGGREYITRAVHAENMGFFA